MLLNFGQNQVQDPLVVGVLHIHPHDDIVFRTDVEALDACNICAHSLNRSLEIFVSQALEFGCGLIITGVQLNINVSNCVGATIQELLLTTDDSVS